jgi:molybdopterin/thiamine biosynthesis adenylyltransferase
MARVIVVGAGGNIGSHLTGHLARMRGVTDVHLIDRDTYEPGNVGGQAIDQRDVGKPKVVVRAKHMHRVNRTLAIAATHRAVEDVPLGSLRGDVILGCLDSRRARLMVNQAAWRLGVPYIDAGVSANGLLARVQVFAPGLETPCFECALSEVDYLAVEQDYPCHAASAPTPANAPSSLGALAAALQAMECEKLLAGNTDDLLLGRELLLSARHHTHFVTRMRRNPACRMPDHEPWAILRTGGPTVDDSVGEVLALGATLHAADGHLVFGVAGQSLALSVACSTCGRTKPRLCVERTVRVNPTLCWRCRRPMLPMGFALYDMLPARSLPPAALHQRLSRTGVQAGDVLTFSTRSAVAHYEVRGGA